MAISKSYATSPQISGNTENYEKENDKALKGDQGNDKMENAPGYAEHVDSQGQAKVNANKNPKGPEELQSETSKVKPTEHPHGETGPSGGVRTSLDTPNPKAI
ncbi:MAG: hypothetical protein CYPHOPRED_005800 [Cyphobasidiales sp. Tagirdzhanova-0007]|nr:MAG: hypothetical protein CYPHOPRED_005800 [Cyphobasidiales sp. Tagirdzhanova-0007]